MAGALWFLLAPRRVRDTRSTHKRVVHTGVTHVCTEHATSTVCVCSAHVLSAWPRARARNKHSVCVQCTRIERVAESERALTQRAVKVDEDSAISDMSGL